MLSEFPLLTCLHGAGGERPGSIHGSAWCSMRETEAALMAAGVRWRHERSESQAQGDAKGTTVLKPKRLRAKDDEIW